MLMIDDTPYIIVDNQKIAPVSRMTPSDSATAEKQQREDKPFGVVDRVTISSAAKEKYRQQQFLVEVDPPALIPSSKGSRTPAMKRLTNSPGKRY